MGTPKRPQIGVVHRPMLKPRVEQVLAQLKPHEWQLVMTRFRYQSDPGRPTSAVRLSESYVQSCCTNGFQKHHWADDFETKDEWQQCSRLDHREVADPSGEVCDVLFQPLDHWSEVAAPEPAAPGGSTRACSTRACSTRRSGDSPHTRDTHAILTTFPFTATGLQIHRPGLHL